VDSSTSLSGKVAVVTGAGSEIGMGLVMARALAEHGARVAMLDNDERTLSESSAALAQEFVEDRVMPWVLDVSDPAQVDRVVADVLATLGRVDVLINNAGIGVGAGKPRGPFWDLPIEVWEQIIAVNYLGAAYMARACTIAMLRQGTGSIIGVTTSLDTMWMGWNTPYGASKAAHEAMLASMAINLEGTGVRANVLVPGGMADTHLIGSEFTGDRASLIRPEVMRAPVVWLASDEAKDVTGKRIIATLWDESLPVDERLRAAGAPAAWQPLGRRSVWQEPEQ
jgi:3-oxoacyl-[acyl-carrier protein] reductase